MTDPTLRPVLSKLHPVLIEPELPNEPVADWLTAYLDEWLFFVSNRGREFALNYCRPATCPDDALDWLASLIAADFKWDASWKPIQKRRILVNLRYLRETRGSANTFRWMLGNFDLVATFEPLGGWIVGGAGVGSPLPVTLSGSPFDFRVSYSVAYIDSSFEFLLIQDLVQEFLPAWISVVLSASL